MPPVSVIVVLWNAAPTLDRCLTSLAESSVPTEVICVDNASADGSADLAARAGARVLHPGRNLGFPAAVNLALASAQGEHVLLLNPDVTVEPDTIERCLDALGEPGVGVVGANLVRPDGRPDQPAARRFRTLPLLVIETFALQKLSRRLDLQYLPASQRSTDRDVECVNGAFMLLRRDLLVALGGLDEAVFLFLEDQDLCRRVRERGLRVRFVAGARATHVAGAATGAAEPRARATIYLHRMDASIELIDRLQGHLHRRAAIALWTLRCAIGAATKGLWSQPERRRYVTGLRWLSRQWGHRVAPPPVP